MSESATAVLAWLARSSSQGARTSASSHMHTHSARSRSHSASYSLRLDVLRRCSTPNAGSLVLRTALAVQARHGALTARARLVGFGWLQAVSTWKISRRPSASTWRRSARGA